MAMASGPGALCVILGMVAAGLALDSSAFAAPAFTVIGTAPGYAQVGALKGGTLYGTLPYNGDGVLFSMSLSGTYTALHNFTAVTDGSGPRAQLAIDKQGNLYGTTGSGGAYGAGTLWEYTKAGKFRTLHSFGSGADGAVPMQGPAFGQDAIFGSTAEGAIGGSGNIFSYGHKGGYDVLYDFMSGQDGHCPFSGVAVSKSGTLYGTTVGVGYGGNPNGSVWQYTSTGGLQTLYVFTDGADGEWPTQAPAIDGAGDVFGTTSTQNGSSFAGAVWKIDKAGHFAIMHSLNGAADGYGPNSPLLLDRNGLLFGTASSGGAANDGTVFSVTKGGAFTVVHSFTDTGDGEQPTGNLVQDSQTSLYGGTGTGQVFKIVP